MGFVLFLSAHIFLCHLVRFSHTCSSYSPNTVLLRAGSQCATAEGDCVFSSMGPMLMKSGPGSPGAGSIPEIIPRGATAAQPLPQGQTEDGDQREFREN